MNLFPKFMIQKIPFFSVPKVQKHKKTKSVAW